MVMGYGLRVTGYRLWIMGYGLRVIDKKERLEGLSFLVFVIGR
jgi:hypothetical protein